MIERLTSHARAIVVAAAREAEALGSPLVGDDDSDILAGVVKANGRGRRLFAEIGIDVNELEQRVELDPLFAPGPGFR